MYLTSQLLGVTSLTCAGRHLQWPDEHPPASHMYRAPSLDTLPKIMPNQPIKAKELRRQRSYARDLARDVKNFHSSKQGLYDFYPKVVHDDHGEFSGEGLLGLNVGLRLSSRSFKVSELRKA